MKERRPERGGITEGGKGVERKRFALSVESGLTRVDFWKALREVADL